MREIKFRAWNGSSMHIIDMSSFGNNEAELLRDTVPRLPLMQYTGLKDKNGVEIYEGDIVGDGFHSWEVRWDNDWAGFFCYLDGERNQGMLTSDHREVIGNIYENPELLNS